VVFRWVKNGVEQAQVIKEADGRWKGRPKAVIRARGKRGHVIPGGMVEGGSQRTDIRGGLGKKGGAKVVVTGWGRKV